MYTNRPEVVGASPVGDLVDDWFHVAAFVASVDTTLGKWLTDHHGIALTEYRTLRHLSAAPDKEIRINELANRIGLNQSSVTRLLGRLEARGLTRRDTCFEDGRGVYAVITAEGEDLVKDAREPFRTHLEQTLEGVKELYLAIDALPVGRALTGIGDRLDS